ncbi:MAG: NACHT domain-containing protein [Spirulina sp.]
MNRPRNVDTPRQKNARSLSTLLRALLLSQGQFALILVRCNYHGLRERLWQQYQEEVFLRSPSLAPLKAIHLDPSVSTLLSPLLDALEDEKKKNQKQEIQSSPLPALPASPDAPDASPTPSPLPSALVVFGLELVKDPDRLFKATNQVREEFRKHLSIPVIFWVTDDLLQKLTRLAPDFKSWAAASIKFELPLGESESAALLWQITDNLFRQLLKAGAEKFLPNEALDLAPGCRTRRELECARNELLPFPKRLNPVSKATWQFLLGRDAYQENRIDEAVKLFQKSLNFWCQGTGYWSIGNWLLAAGDEGEPDLASRSSQKTGALTLPRRFHLANPFLEEKGLVLFHLGLCYGRVAQQNPADAEEAWQEAKKCFGASLEIFTVKSQSNFTAGLIVQLGTVLQQLEEWSALKGLSLYALNCLSDRQSPMLNPRAYGFLARVALEGGEWQQAETLAEQALESMSKVPYPLPQDRAGYLLLLARVKHRQGDRQLAMEQLQSARQLLLDRWAIADDGDPLGGNGNAPARKERLYLEILEELRWLYCENQQYKSAFTLKQERQFVEHYCGLRAFHGLYPLATTDRAASGGNLWENVIDRRSQEAIAASGRRVIVDDLLETLTSHDRKLTILHGASGVGKSSLLRGCLLSALQEKPIAARNALPILQATYRHWERDLCYLFDEAIAKALPQESPPSPSEEPWRILQQLQYHLCDRVFTVLIFDQFEEFFFLCPQIEQRQKFYEFLRDALSIPFVKVILSIREDYLHHLLEIETCVELRAIDNNMLDRRNRYCLKDLTPQETHQAIVHLTENSQFHLEPALIDAFVEDLSRERGRVRPVELHLVGAQLQSDRIDTLKAYQALGEDPKTVLVTRSLLAIVADCGEENQDIAWRTLFALTAENSTRPLKTKSELVSVISYQLTVNSAALRLDSILEILVNSRLVFRFPEDPEDRYQLARDYFVAPIRQQYRRHFTSAIEASLERQQQELVRERKQRFTISLLGAAMAVLALISGYLAWHARDRQHIAQQKLIRANLLAESAASESLFVSGRRFDALLAALRAGRQLQKSVTRHPLSSNQQNNPQQVFPLPVRGNIDATTQFKTIAALDRALRGTKERNRLFGHKDVIWDVVFSADGRLLASASLDRSVKLWCEDGRLLAALTGHEDSVTSVDLYQTPQGTRVVSSSWDGSLRLWQLPARPCDSPGGETLTIPPPRTFAPTASTQDKEIYNVRFSPDGRYLATAGKDGTIRLQTLEGTAIATFSAGSGAVQWVEFSPNGQLLAAAGNDRGVQLWNRSGELLNVFRGHTGGVTYVAFSPDGETIASASRDGTIKLWDLNGNERQTLTGHEGGIWAVGFRPDGKAIVSAGHDGQIKLWDRRGNLLETFASHRDRVTGARFHPQGKLLASSSFDKTIKLWDLQGNPRLVLHNSDAGNAEGEGKFGIRDVDISPDGQLVVTAGENGTIIVWTRQGKKLTRIFAHTDTIERVSFAPDGNLFASGSWDGTIKIWNRLGQLQAILSAHQDRVADLNWSPNSKLLVSGGWDGLVKVWDSQGKLQETLQRHRQRVHAVTFNPEGNLLVTGGEEGIYWWPEDELGRFSGLTPLPLADSGTWIMDLQFLPAGNLQGTDARFVLAAGGYDNAISFWDDRDRLLGSLRGHTDSIRRFAADPTGEILATISWDNDVELWHANDTLLTTWEEHQGEVVGVSWSSDGSAIATAGRDGTARIWSLDLDALVAESCRWLGDYLRHSAMVQKSDRALCNEQ